MDDVVEKHVPPPFPIGQRGQSVRTWGLTLAGSDRPPPAAWQSTTLELFPGRDIENQPGARALARFRDCPDEEIPYAPRDRSCLLLHKSTPYFEAEQI